MPMTLPTLPVRRATIEDVPKLLALWKLEHLPAAELENRFKEFQVVENETGELIGALGLQIAGTEGRVHSEAFAHFDQADTLRPQLLERAKTVAVNHGLVRLWTQLNPPFWRIQFHDPSAETLTRLPPSFAASAQPWLYLQLRDEPNTAMTFDKEFALFREAEQQSREKVKRQAQLARVVAAVVVALVFILIGVWAYLFMKARSLRPTP